METTLIHLFILGGNISQLLINLCTSCLPVFGSWQNMFITNSWQRSSKPFFKIITKLLLHLAVN